MDLDQEIVEVPLDVADGLLGVAAADWGCSSEDEADPTNLGLRLRAAREQAALVPRPDAGAATTRLLAAAVKVAKTWLGVL